MARFTWSYFDIYYYTVFYLEVLHVDSLFWSVPAGTIPALFFQYQYEISVRNNVELNMKSILTCIGFMSRYITDSSLISLSFT